jgi:ABC-2 type transport system ATP-binding protein
MSAVSLERVSKTYRRSWGRAALLAVDDVSFAIAEGEAFGFIGANGAGKSTTIKMLTGALQPSAGTLQLLGHAVGDPESRRGLGYVPENPSLPDLLTPLEILSMAMHLHGVKAADPRRHCLDWLARFSLAHVAAKPIRTFSKGMAQRVALAHAMVIRPRLLILDEPLSGLDPIGRKEVVDILEEYHRAGGTLFFSSHVLHDVERLADRYGLIHQGRLRAVRSPGELVGEGETVVVRSRGEQAVDGMTAETAGSWYAELPRAELWPLLERLRHAGHVIVEVKPTLSLESAFLKIVRQDAGAVR